VRCVSESHAIAIVHADYFGGRVGKDMGEGSMNDLWSFDTSTNTWSEVQAQHGEPPCKVRCITLNDILLLIMICYVELLSRTQN
jgi:N-acetylneuraminic acid mutarotase